MVTPELGIGVAFVVLGPLLAYGSFMAWKGRWRSWTGEVLLAPQAVPITVMPAMSAFLLLLGLDLLGALPRALGPLVGLAVFLTIPAFLISFFTPRWWGPRWYREAKGDFEPNLNDPLTAVAMASSLPDPPRRPLPPQFAGRPLDSWKGNFVERDDQAMRNALARKGKLEGRLNLYDAGMTFVAHRWVTRLDDDPFDPIVLEADDVLDVRVVPAGAGPDGQRRRGTGLRSLFKRLVIDTPDGPLLFEVQRAEVVQREIQGAL